ncbi:sensor histidine kinase [Leptospira tipperaryensis]|uniref:sensor histidine kinase n=1 Tax=Leptospira tipperaryensis TaxID=2564040 RepID=UPI001FE0765C|nr:HAMP domain-containing sensor histidine kinase [Leptospira tipperaryensis]
MQSFKHASKANGWIVNTNILTEEMAFLTESAFPLLSHVRTPIGILDDNLQVTDCNLSFASLCGEEEIETCKGKYLERILKIRNVSLFGEFKNSKLEKQILFQDRIENSSGKEMDCKGVLTRINFGTSEILLLEILEILNEQSYQKKEKELSAVVSKMYHDLQEPIRNLTSFLKLLVQRSSTELSPKGQEFLQISLAGADRLWNRINSLLSFLRIEKEKRLFLKISLKKTIEESLIDLKDDPEASELDVEWKGEFPEIVGNEPLLRELFLNLFQNAIRFRKPNERGRVIVSYQDSPGAHRIRIQDDGIGVELKENNYFIELFHRYPNAEGLEGVGAGLFFCKKIAELHGGSLEIETSLNSGFSVTISLPREFKLEFI